MIKRETVTLKINILNPRVNEITTRMQAAKRLKQIIEDGNWIDIEGDEGTYCAIGKITICRKLITRK